MSQNPLVLCVMLAAGRLSMVKRAVESFKAQTYPNRALYILDNGDEPLGLDLPIKRDGNAYMYIDRLEPKDGQRLPIGKLRNIANSLSGSNVIDAPLIAHWDSDDWYHPDRLSFQVELLHANGSGVVGFRSSLFWDAPVGDPNKTLVCACGQQWNQHMHTVCPECGAWPRGEAWLYTSQNPEYCLGSSLLYRRELWQKTNFKEVHTAEDTLWLHNRFKVTAVHAMPEGMPGTAMMIAGLHGGNTCSRIQEGKREWQRVPTWDAECRRIMQL